MSVSSLIIASLAFATSICFCMLMSVRPSWSQELQHPVSLMTHDSRDDNPRPRNNETVMSQGMKITADTPQGVIIITAGPGLQRSYTWDGATRSVKMLRRRERWCGSFGLYYPGAGYHWKDNYGIRRGVLQEGQQHFETTVEANKWIQQQESAVPSVHRPDGLMVGFKRVLARKQINVDVWQIFIAGEKPTSLSGSQNKKIDVTLSNKK
jgi:hypothetical protein